MSEGIQRVRLNSGAKFFGIRMEILVSPACQAPLFDVYPSKKEDASGIQGISFPVSVNSLYAIREKKIEQKPIEIIHPSTFSSKAIMICVCDQSERAALTQTLTTAGGTIISELSLAADIIVSDHPIKRQLPSMGRSRGTKIAESFGICKPNPRIILTNQIPWALKVQIKKEICPPSKQEVVPGVVVAEIRSIYRPLAKNTASMPEINFDPVPKGYNLTPFAPPPKEFRRYFEMVKNVNTPQKIQNPPNGLADEGYCELCGCSYQNASAHRESAEHARRASTPSLWLEFDDFSASLNHEFG